MCKGAPGGQMNICEAQVFSAPLSLLITYIVELRAPIIVEFYENYGGSTFVTVQVLKLSETKSPNFRVSWSFVETSFESVFRGELVADN